MGGDVDQSEESAAFDRLYRACQQEVFGFLLARLRQREAALDCLQECFLRVWRSRDRLPGMRADDRRFWLFAVARNLATDFARRRETRREAMQVPLREDDRMCGAQPGQAMELSEQAAAVDHAVAGLPEEERTVVMMSLLGGMDSQQIAAVLEMPAGTVRSRLSRARERLRQMLLGNQEQR